MLITGHRIQTLSLIDVREIKINENKIKIKITAPIKTSKPGKSQPMLNLPFYPNENVCVAKALTNYLYRTKNLRKNVNSLLISFKKPHKKVGTQTLSRWIKRTLKESGVDTDVFSAYSVRHASTSAAKRAGVSIDVIKRTAGWSKDSQVFAKYYDLEIKDDDNTFANSILNL